MDLGLTGKVAVVTGASRGIGRAVVDALLEEGALVAAGAREVSTLVDLPNVLAVSVDLAQPDGPGGLVQAAVERFGGVDYVVNNVAMGRLHFEGFGSITDEDWQAAFDLNFMSAVRCVRAALPYLVARHGAIVNVSSLNGRVPATEAPEYSATKAALNNLSRALALELAPQGVRVNTISPGPVLTDMQIGSGGIAEQVAAASGSSVDDYMAEVARAVPLGRFADPAEIAALVVLALSDCLSYVTGAELSVDGATL